MYHVKMANQTPVTLFLTRETSDESVSASSGDVSVDSEVESEARVEGGMNVHVGDWVVVEYEDVSYPREAPMTCSGRR